MKKVFSILAAAFVLACASTVSAQQAAQAQNPSPFQPAPGRNTLSQIQGFNIVLLVGESQASGGSVDDVPAAARKALADLRDFLPFKHYRLVDTQWTSCCSEAQSQSLRGRLQGTFPWEADRQAEVKASYILQVSSGAKLNVKFTLEHDAPPRQGQKSSNRHVELERRAADLRRELDAVDDEIAKRRERVGEKHPDVMTLMNQRLRLEQRMAETMNGLAEERTRQTLAHVTEAPMLMDSTFSMEPGETVVVGTSRFGGDKALIAIVTAVKKGTAAR